MPRVLSPSSKRTTRSHRIPAAVGRAGFRDQARRYASSSLRALSPTPVGQDTVLGSHPPSYTLLGRPSFVTPSAVITGLDPAIPML
ncbi:hypothetical protein J4G37_14925 [Microvirga sp. 3-52]|nr:hypothetical protein [Microvirga sp. 3-52]